MPLDPPSQHALRAHSLLSSQFPRQTSANELPAPLVNGVYIHGLAVVEALWRPTGI